MIVEPYRVVVSGTRYWDDYAFFEKRMNQVLRHLPHEDVHLIGGGAKTGADKLLERYVKDYDFKYTRFPADWDGPYKKAAGHQRNKQMAVVGTHLVSFWDGVSRGSKNMIDIARSDEYHLVVQIYRIPVSEKTQEASSWPTAQKPRNSSSRW